MVSLCDQVEDNYQRQMGVTAQQQRTDAYMRSHTLTHQAILNPTSRVPVYPSEAVLVKPVAFGLGRASPEAVRKVAARHASTSASAAAAGGELQDCLLLPSKYRCVWVDAGLRSWHQHMQGKRAQAHAVPAWRSECVNTYVSNASVPTKKRPEH